jgi:hypothetical protein
MTFQLQSRKWHERIKVSRRKAHLMRRGGMAVPKASRLRGRRSLFCKGEQDRSLQILALRSWTVARESTSLLKTGRPRREKGSRRDERAMWPGMRPSTESLCPSPPSELLCSDTDILDSQAYPKNGSAASEEMDNQDALRLGDDEEDQGDAEGDGAGVIPSEESRLWEQTDEADIVQQPQYGVTGGEFENVWDGERARTDGP